jgi:signal transduction histidine kinase/ActR/RegA family two-component response regulator
LILISMALLLAFAGVAWIQSQSLALLRGSVQYNGGSVVWSFFQLETEYLRLRDSLHSVLLAPGSVPLDAMQQRYEVFVSRVRLVRAQEPDAIRQPGSPGARVMAQLDRFVVEADRVLGEGVDQAPTASQLQALSELLAPLAEPLHDLSLQAYLGEAERIGQRNDAVQVQYRIGIGLTIFQSLLTLVFAVIVMRQLGVLERRRRTLEELAEHLRQAQLEAESASQAKSAFLTNMSHELRTPFNGLLGMLSLLQASPLTASQAEHLRTAQASGEHLLAILNDVLDIARLESGRLELSLQTVDLLQLVHDTEALMRPQAQAKSLDFRVVLGDQVPRWVQADAKRLKQILFNLLSNAIKFCDAGSVTLTVALQPAATLPAAVPLQFSVTDTGLGIDDLTQARLFQRFSQGDASITRRFGGTGLGLEISRNLARLMGGDITVRSRVGQGSCFTVEVLLWPVDAVSVPPLQAEPLQAPIVPAADARMPQEAPTVVPMADGAGAGPLRILVADDHPVNRILMEAMLGRLGHATQLCDNGAEAVEWVKREPFDLVLMDVHMPVMDGLSATSAIRQLPAPAGQVLIIALTADAYSDSRDRVLAAGMNDFLAKPVQLPQVDALLRKYFGARL